MTRLRNGTVAALVVAALAAATAATPPAAAQGIIDFDQSLLPGIPSTHGMSAEGHAANAMPRASRGGVEVGEGIIFDRLVRPRCILIANLNQGGPATQTVRVGSLTFNCP